MESGNTVLPWLVAPSLELRINYSYYVWLRLSQSAVRFVQYFIYIKDTKCFFYRKHSDEWKGRSAGGRGSSRAHPSRQTIPHMAAGPRSWPHSQRFRYQSHSLFPLRRLQVWRRTVTPVRSVLLYLLFPLTVPSIRIRTDSFNVHRLETLSTKNRARLFYFTIKLGQHAKCALMMMAHCREMINLCKNVVACWN